MQVHALNSKIKSITIDRGDIQSIYAPIGNSFYEVDTICSPGIIELSLETDSKDPFARTLNDAMRNRCFQFDVNFKEEWKCVSCSSPNPLTPHIEHHFCSQCGNVRPSYLCEFSMYDLVYLKKNYPNYDTWNIAQLDMSVVSIRTGVGFLADQRVTVEATLQCSETDNNVKLLYRLLELETSQTESYNCLWCTTENHMQNSHCTGCGSPKPFVL